MKKGSRNSLKRHPRKQRKTDRPGNGAFGNSHSVARFDDVAVWSVRHAFVDVAVDSNGDPQSMVWNQSKSQDLLDRIYELLRAYPIVGKGNYASLLCEKKARLVVALVADITTPVETISVPQDGSPFSGETLEFRSVPILLAATENTDEPAINLTQERWGIACRKFGLPGKQHVKGPYLLITAINNATNLPLRARMWPIWLETHMNTFAVVRSGYERLAAKTVHSLGGVCLLPIHKEQLESLQKAFDTRWLGDPSSYAYLPDMLLFPERGEIIAIVEIFGLCAFKKYADGKRGKEIAAEKGSTAATYFFLSIQTRELRSGDCEIVIHRKVEAWYRAELRTLWRKAKYATS